MHNIMELIDSNEWQIKYKSVLILATDLGYAEMISKDHGQKCYLVTYLPSFFR